MFDKPPASKLFISYVLLFVVSLIVIFFFFFATLPKFKTKKYIIHFEKSVYGLKVGSAVNYKGVLIGAVDSIKIDLPECMRVSVVIRIDRNIPINKGCIATLSATSIIYGNSIIDLSNASDSKELLDGKLPEIEYKNSVVEEVMDKFPKILLEVNNLVKNLNILITKNDGNIEKCIDNFNKSLVTLIFVLKNIEKSTQNFNNTTLVLVNQILEDVYKEVRVIKDRKSISQLFDRMNYVANKLKISMSPSSNSKVRWLING